MQAAQSLESSLDDLEATLAAHEGSPRAPLTKIEQAITQVGARYVADLQGLAEKLGRYYGAQLMAKEEEIASLTSQLKQVEQERQDLQSQIQQLKQTNAQYVADLKAFREQLGQFLACVNRGSSD